MPCVMCCLTSFLLPIFHPREVLFLGRVRACMPSLLASQQRVRIAALFFLGTILFVRVISLFFVSMLGLSMLRTIDCRRVLHCILLSTCKLHFLLNRRIVLLFCLQQNLLLCFLL